jgi:hypothetical protein
MFEQNKLILYFLGMITTGALLLGAYRPAFNSLAEKVTLLVVGGFLTFLQSHPPNKVEEDIHDDTH